VKLYVVARRDLPAGAQAAQACHAALAWARAHPELAGEWVSGGETLVLLGAPDEPALARLHGAALARGLRATAWTEPDLGDALTAVALEPGDAARRLCGKLPLLLAA
jgi:peptidyl-tRNA hydrolase